MHRVCSGTTGLCLLFQDSDFGDCRSGNSRPVYSDPLVSGISPKSSSQLKMGYVKLANIHKQSLT